MAASACGNRYVTGAKIRAACLAARFMGFATPFD